MIQQLKTRKSEAFQVNPQIRGKDITFRGLERDMDSDIISRIFAVIQNLEKCLVGVKNQLEVGKEDHAEIRKLLPQQEKVLTQMRRVANKLQLQFAREDWSEVIRSLKIFYGLNHLVRTDLMMAYGLVNSPLPGKISPQFLAQKEGICH